MYWVVLFNLLLFVLKIVLIGILMVLSGFSLICCFLVFILIVMLFKISFCFGMGRERVIVNVFVVGFGLVVNFLICVG